MVSVNSISVEMNNQTLIQNVSCTLLAGRITIFIGESGAGKTTLLKSLIGLMPLKKGEIFVENKPLTLDSKQRSETIGYVFQDFNLFPHLTVLENCIDPLIVHGMNAQQAQRHALDILKQLGMNDYSQKYPVELSGGQQQRVAIARSLCLKPQVLLLDEPTASLDPVNTNALVAILQLFARQGLTIALSSQDMSFVRKVFDRVYLIESGTITEYCDDISQLSQSGTIQNFMS